MIHLLKETSQISYQGATEFSRLTTGPLPCVVLARTSAFLPDPDSCPTQLYKHLCKDRLFYDAKAHKLNVLQAHKLNVSQQAYFCL